MNDAWTDPSMYQSTEGLVFSSEALSRTNENFRLWVHFRFRPGTWTAYKRKKQQKKGERAEVSRIYLTSNKSRLLVLCFTAITKRHFSTQNIKLGIEAFFLLTHRPRHFLTWSTCVLSMLSTSRQKKQQFASVKAIKTEPGKIFFNILPPRKCYCQMVNFQKSIFPKADAVVT